MPVNSRVSGVCVCVLVCVLVCVCMYVCFQESVQKGNKYSRSACPAQKHKRTNWTVCHDTGELTLIPFWRSARDKEGVVTSCNPLLLEPVS